MLRGTRIKRVERQRIFAFKNFQSIQIGGDGNCTAHPAIRAGATARRVKAIGKFDAKAHCSAVAGTVGYFDIGVHAGLLFQETDISIFTALPLPEVD